MTDDERAQSMVVDIVSLLHKTFGKEREVTGWDRGDFLSLGSTRDALVYSILFAPTFVEIEGFIFLEAFAPQTAGGWAKLATDIQVARAKPGNDLALLLAGYNWVEVAFLFSDPRGSDEELTALAYTIADAWRVRLRGLYADRTFEVRVLPASETGSSIGVGFKEVLTS